MQKNKPKFKWEVREKRKKIFKDAILILAAFLPLASLLICGFITGWNYSAMGIIGWIYTIMFIITN